MTSPSLSSNETISLPDETNETDATATPSSISSKKSRLHPQKREMSETNRRINLEKDLYTTGVQSKSVQCTECLREIRFVDYNIIAATCAFDVDPTFSLDKRWQYYDYPWRKHRRTCLMIKIAEVRPTPWKLRFKVLKPCLQTQRLQNEAIRNDAFFSETPRSAPHAKNPGETLKWIQVDGLGTVDAKRRKKEIA